MDKILWILPIIISLWLVIYIHRLKNNYIEKRKEELEEKLQDYKASLAKHKQEEFNKLNEELITKRNENNWQIKELSVEYDKKQAELSILNEKLNNQSKELANKTELLAQGQELINNELKIYRLKETDRFNQDILQQKTLVNQELDTYKSNELKRISAEIEQKKEDLNQQYQLYSLDIEKQMATAADRIKVANEQIAAVQSELDEYQKKRESVNQEILRQREIEEKQDFYRIILDENSKRDIQLLNSIRPQLSKLDLLDKLIYDIYIKHPVDEMVKRVLKGQSPSGIYKITRLKTGEAYIGKSTDIKARWVQHSKSAYHCGTISHSTLHTTMEKDGIDNFTFELLEEVPKDQLNEREKYWITFYDTKTYGLNQKEGG